MKDPKSACRYTEAELKLSEIRLDPSLQPREQIDEQAVRDYADDMGRDGIDAFPTVVVFDDGSELLLVDGFHRFMAAQSLGHETIHCRLYSGSRLEARWFACGCNQRHGLQRTTADKRRAVDCALRCDPAKSDSDIARHVGVCGKTVGDHRRRLRSTSEIPESAHRVGADGRSVNTTNIGKRTKKLPNKRTNKLGPKEKPAENPAVNPAENPDVNQGGVESTAAAETTSQSSNQAQPVSAPLSPQSAADGPLQADSWDQLRDWLHRRIQAQGREVVWAELHCILDALGFPIETTDQTGPVARNLSPSNETAGGERPDTAVVVQDWISVRMEPTDEKDP